MSMRLRSHHSLGKNPREDASQRTGLIVSNPGLPLSGPEKRPRIPNRHSIQAIQHAHEEFTGGEFFPNIQKILNRQIK